MKQHIKQLLKPFVHLAALVLSFAGVAKFLPRKFSFPIVIRIPRKYREFDTVIKFRGINLKINVGSSTGQVLYFMDEYKPIQFSFFESLLKPNTLFFDFGANLGTLTALAIKHNVKTIAFEPDPSLCQYYIRPTIALNKGNELTKVVCEAVADKKGIATFWLHRLNHLGSGRLYKAEWWEESPTITIPTDTLDNYVQRFGKPDLIKMHIEGAEVLAIRGSKKIFEDPDAPTLIVEFHTVDIQAISPNTSADDLINELKGYGYEMKILTEPKYKESTWHVFFKKPLSEKTLKYFNSETGRLGGYFSKYH